MAAAPASVARRSFGFSGAGLLGVWHVGVWSRLAEETSSGLFCARRDRFIGSSAGSIVSAAIACELDIPSVLKSFEEINNVVGNRTWGVLDPRVDLLTHAEKLCYDMFPNDAHERCSGRVTVCTAEFVSLPWQWMLVETSNWASKAELIESIMCSSYMPYLTSKRHRAAFDGGMVQNWPAFDDKTILCSPFRGHFHVSPPYDADESATVPWRILMHDRMVDASLYNIVAGLQSMRYVRSPMDVYENGREACDRFIASSLGLNESKDL